MTSRFATENFGEHHLRLYQLDELRTSQSWKGVTKDRRNARTSPYVRSHKYRELYNTGKGLASMTSMLALLKRVVEGLVLVVPVDVPDASVPGAVLNPSNHTLKVQQLSSYAAQ